MNKNPLVSIILPTHNNQDTITKCLGSLVHQGYSPLELIVVDDASSDKTVECINKALAAHTPYSFNVLLLEQHEHQGRSRSKNRGYKISQGEVVFFAEANAHYSRLYVQRCVWALMDDYDEVGGVIGPDLQWQTDELLSDYQDQKRRLILTNYKPKSAQVYKRKAFNWGVFHSEVEYGEDLVLAERVKAMGYKLVFVHAAKLWHKYPTTLKGLAVKEFEAGRNSLNYYSLTGEGWPFKRLIGWYIFFSLLLALPLKLLSFNIWSLAQIGKLYAIDFIAYFSLYGLFFISAAWTINQKGKRVGDYLDYLFFHPLVQYINILAGGSGLMYETFRYAAGKRNRPPRYYRGKRRG